jgi:hypothetical protein
LEQLFLRNVGPRALAKAPPVTQAPVAAAPAVPSTPVAPDAPTIVLAPQPRKSFLQLILDAFTLRRRSRA